MPLPSVTVSTPISLELLSPAKLNLFLHITGRREDGYHLLQTLFQFLDYGDTIQFESTEAPEIVLNSNCPEIDNEDNLIFKAARLLQTHSKTSSNAKNVKGVKINLKKILPLGGGLGGGSSNAASTLLALNKLWDTRLNLTQLAQLALELGADVPVFIHGRTAWAQGVGEILTPMPLPELWFVVLTPHCHASTKEIFCHEQLTRDTTAIKIAAFPISGSKNDCEQVAQLLYPEIENALKWLNQYSLARMTGTGASIFASFDSKEAAIQVLQDKPEELDGFIAQGVNTSPAHQQHFL